MFFLTSFGNDCGTFKLLQEYISFEIPNILRMHILPMGVRFLFFQQFSNFCIDSNLSEKFKLSISSLQYEKCAPSAFIGFSGHKIPNNWGLLCLSFPSHNPSHFRLFSLRPDTFSNSSIIFNTVSADYISSMKIVVSSATWVNTILLSLMVIPLMFLFVLEVWARLEIMKFDLGHGKS